MKGELYMAEENEKKPGFVVHKKQQESTPAAAPEKKRVLVVKKKAPAPLLAANNYGGLTYSEDEGRFYTADGTQIRLTPMQHQLMEMFFHSPSHSLSKTEICETLWPKKPDASDTLYTLIRRMKPVIEQHSDLKIEADRGRAYELKIK